MTRRPTLAALGILGIGAALAGLPALALAAALWMAFALLTERPEG